MCVWKVMKIFTKAVISTGMSAWQLEGGRGEGEVIPQDFIKKVCLFSFLSGR